MRKLLVTLVASMAFIGAAFAGEVEGTVQSIDTDAMKIVLDNGSEFAIGDGVSLQGIVAGTPVKIVFNDDTKVATAISLM